MVFGKGKQKGYAYWKGKKFSKKHKEKISEANKGRIGYWKGKKRSENTKRKMRKAKRNKRSDLLERNEKLKGKTYEERYGIKKANEIKNKLRMSKVGTKMLEDTKIKIGLKSKELWKNPEYRKKMKTWKDFNDDPEFQRKRLMACIKKPNKLEELMINLIEKHKLPFKYVGDGQVIIGRFNPDFISNNPKHLIEVFGDYWHNLPRYKELDERRLKTYLKHGYKTLILWEHEIKGMTEKGIVKRIKEFINN